MITLLLLALATLASEDLTCISAGLLVRRGELHWSQAVLGCLAGIYVGDLGLWALGRGAGRQVLRARWLVRPASAVEIERLSAWFDRNAAKAIFAARFVPGTRVPLYIAAGALGRKGVQFAIWTLLAASIWTPSIVLLTAILGDIIAEPFKRFVGTGISGLVGAALAIFLVLKIGCLCLTEVQRAKVVARISRIWRWEFWPTWLFYPPVALWIAWLSLRHRGFAIITAANPGIPNGGFVGESKYRILKSLGSEHISPTALIAPGKVAARAAQVASLGWGWPIILKPDVGRRGAGVKLVRHLKEAEHYFAGNAAAVLVQPYHPGPLEAGIFYYRYPAELRGHIFSITDKRFPAVVGDGLATVEELIWRHSRYRMQASTFLRRFQSMRSYVPAAGERFALGLAGNHCQGTLFCDGAHLMTPELEAAVDRVACRFKGFYFGRFDVRYSDVEAFKAGEDFTVIELNGITSESTNIYDPSWSLLRAYRTLFRQWQIVFEIAAINYGLIGMTSSFKQLAGDIGHFYRSPRPASLAD